MTASEKFEAFKQLHQRPGAFVIPNPWDAGSARILTALGFEALATTSAGYAFSIGLPDYAPEITREGTLLNYQAIVQSTHLPVSADLANGYGSSSEACATTVRMATEIGLAGGSIEDSTGDPTAPIYDLELAVERVAAAAEAADHRFFLTARAETFLYGGTDLDETIKRLQAFAEAGADVLYAPGLPSLDAIRAVCSSVSKPVNVLAGLKGVTVQELTEAGAKRISVGGMFARVALSALVRAAREVQEQGTFSYASEAISHGDVTALITANQLS